MVRRTARGRLLRRAGEHAGLIIAALAAIAFVLGMIGLRTFVPGKSTTDYVYRTLELFVVYVEHSGAAEPVRTPVALDIARFLAPAAAAAASIRALLALFGQKAARAWVRYFVRDHVVVCGLGPVGARLALAFREEGHRVVAVERNGDDAAVHDCRDAGVIVIVGDPTDRRLLVRAGLLAARSLVVASGDDSANAEVALAARDVAGRRRRALPCYVHVVHPGLSGLLAEAALGAGAGSGRLRLEFFDPQESVPPMVLDDHPPGPAMLVVGTGRLGRALVAHAARRRAIGPEPAPGPPLRVTLAGPGAEQATADLSARYRRIGEVCALGAAEVDVDSAAFEQAAFVDGREVTSAYVALDDDAAGLRAALALSRALPHVHVVVLTSRQSGLAALVSELRAGSGQATSISLFDVLERGCRPEILRNGTIELLAQALHRTYVRDELAAGRGTPDAPALRDWDELPERLKEANRAQAADIGAKLAAVGRRIRPWIDWTGEGTAFTADEVERMAEMEHERWRGERAADGWTYGPERDEARKRSPYLVPWSDLREADRDKNRNGVRALPDLLAHAGYEIVPGGSAPPPSG